MAKVLLMREGQGLCRPDVLGEKRLCRFWDDIHKVANVPFPHLHLNYPARFAAGGPSRGPGAGQSDLRGHRLGWARPRGVTGGSEYRRCDAHRQDAGGSKDDNISIKFASVVMWRSNISTVPAVLRLYMPPSAEGVAFVLVTHGVQFGDNSPPQQVVVSAFVYRASFERPPGLNPSDVGPQRPLSSKTESRAGAQPVTISAIAWPGAAGQRPAEVPWPVLRTGYRCRSARSGHVARRCRAQNPPVLSLAEIDRAGQVIFIHFTMSALRAGSGSGQSR